MFKGIVLQDFLSFILIMAVAAVAAIVASYFEKEESEEIRLFEEESLNVEQSLDTEEPARD